MKAIRTIRIYKREEIEIDEKFISYDEDNFPYLTDEGLEKYVFSLEKGNSSVCHIETKDDILYGD